MFCVNNKIKEEATVQDVIEIFKEKYEIASENIEEIKNVSRHW